ncbi:UNVERIFIED_CONTAM: hypothetical protein HDU68_007880 [Siphonaria sp. JEL0065]|nr:hypothetical protein HDU68_007880 [Siphonaria sp. JEL0065]
MVSERRTNVLILLDESSNAHDTIASAVTCLDYANPQNQITVINIIDCCRDQQSALFDTTTLLRSFSDRMDPDTKLYVYILPQEMRGLEAAVSKLVKKIQPDLLVFALTICDSVSITNYYYNELSKGNNLGIKYVKPRRSEDTVEVVESDEDSPWCIGNSQRCSSPSGWD